MNVLRTVKIHKDGTGVSLGSFHNYKRLKLERLKSKERNLGPRRVRSLNLVEASPALPRKNLLLDLLPVVELVKVVPLLTNVPLVRNEILYDLGDDVDVIYFPSSGLISETALAKNNGALEVLGVGREGALGVSSLFGLHTSGHRVAVQITGAAWCAQADELRRLLPECPVLHARLQRYFHFCFLDVAQRAVCASNHGLSKRCADKLLATYERCGDATLRLTHQTLADDLGVRRAGVTVALATLARAGHIDLSFSAITIVNKDSLEHASCGCNSSRRQLYDALVAAPLNHKRFKEFS